MIVVYRTLEATACTEQEAQHAVSVYDGVCFVLVIDDLSTPDFMPRALFEVVDPNLPDDWICNTFPTGSVQLVMGPEFIARDADAYNGMIDHRDPQKSPRSGSVYALGVGLPLPTRRSE